MRKLTIAAIGSLAVGFAGPAMAQSFTYDVTWEPVESVGGMTGTEGTQYGGGVVNGTYVTKVSDGTTVNGKVRCVGMGQPDGGIFAIHLACTTKEEGGTGSLVYGCNFLGKPGPDTALGCIGAVEGKEGALKGQRGGLTMHWYSDKKSVGTGQWYTAK